MSVEFKPWPKIPRLFKGFNCVITEKMDGSNGYIIVKDGELVGVQSRKRLITPDKDNFGFAAWVHNNKEVLVEGLGDGYHYGEWVGPGIQKNPHELEEKQFYLFNVHRWREDRAGIPPLCKVVDILYWGQYTQSDFVLATRKLIEKAEEQGYKPEGVIIYFEGFRQSMKYTFENPEGKWKDETTNST